ncbi:MAG TPA: flagellar biosynthesis anti-sigma factor FlgM [Acidisarcina sp.]
MRIDLNLNVLNPLSDDQQTRAVGSAPADHGKAAAPVAVPVNVESGDTATLSSHSREVSALAVKALATPPVRQDKIDALTQALGSGSYELNPGKIADAIVSDRVH